MNTHEINFPLLCSCLSAVTPRKIHQQLTNSQWNIKYKLLEVLEKGYSVFNSEIFSLVNSLVMLNRIIIIIILVTCRYLDFWSVHCLWVSWFSTWLSSTILYLCFIISIFSHKIIISITHSFDVSIPIFTAAYNCKSKKSTWIRKCYSSLQIVHRIRIPALSPSSLVFIMFNLIQRFKQFVTFFLV